MQQLIQVVQAVVQNGVNNNNGPTPITIAKAIQAKRPSTYDGKGDPIKLLNWLREFEKIFETLSCPDNFKLSSATFYLTENADMWWQNKKEDFISPIVLEEDGEDIEYYKGWREFEKAIREEFIPEHVKKAKRIEYNQLTQGNMSVLELYDKLMELLRFVPDMALEESAKVTKFETFLNWEILEKIGEGTFTTVAEMKSHAANIEIRLKNKPDTMGQGGIQKKTSFGKSGVSSGSSYRGNNHRNQGNNSNNLRRTQSQNQTGERVYFCKRCTNNHPGKDCDGNLVECNNCGKLGHRAYECWSKPGGSKRPEPFGSMASNNKFSNYQNKAQSSRANTGQAGARTTGTVNSTQTGRSSKKPRVETLNAVTATEIAPSG